MERAAIFTTVLLLSWLFYLIIHLNITSKYRYLENYIPALPWIFLLVYIFYPSEKYFNYKGRKFILDIIKKVLSNPWAPCLFRDSYLFSNFESLRTPIQDLEYTVCYYVSHNNKEQC